MMGFAEQFTKARKVKRELSVLDEGKDVSYFQNQAKRLAVERDIQEILKKYYDGGNCEMIPVRVPEWAIPIVIKELDDNDITYIVKDCEVDIICE